MNISLREYESYYTTKVYKIGKQNWHSVCSILEDMTNMRTNAQFIIIYIYMAKQFLNIIC
jgi:hypothetical protein